MLVRFKVSTRVILLCLLGVIMLSVFAIAQDTDKSSDNTTSSTDVLAEDEVEFQDAELETSAGITPDSYFYFIDEFFDRFGSDLENREEKIAEIKAMIQAGKYEEAKEALEKYKEYADNLEDEVTPEEQENARESAVAIKKTINEIEDDIPEEYKDEFVNGIIEKEGRIATAARVSHQIKQLCETLAKLDPKQYADVCKVDEDDKDVPKWQKKLDRELTDEQKKEAEEFFKIMSACFRNPRECECDQIKIESFANVCKEKAPLAAECKEGNEEACKKLEEGEDPTELLPPHLQAVFERFSDEFGEAEFENHIPKECREKGITDFKECRKIMFSTHAPKECIDAGITSDDEDAEMKCRKIMMERHFPQECKEAGIDPADESAPYKCSKIMFEKNLPPECKNFIGKNEEGFRQNEEVMQKCRRIMEEIGREREGRFAPPAIGRDCRLIQDPAEKLRCLEEYYEAAQASGFPGKGEGPGGYEKVTSDSFPPECREAGALTPESCEAIFREKYGEQQHPQYSQPIQCPEGSYPKCTTPDSCECVREQQFDCTQYKCADGSYSTYNSEKRICECPTTTTSGTTSGTGTSGTSGTSGTGGTSCDCTGVTCPEGSYPGCKDGSVCACYSA